MVVASSVGHCHDVDGADGENLPRLWAWQGKGKLSLVVWDRFLHHMMPRTTKQERALYFEIASGFGEELDVLGFMDLRQVRSAAIARVCFRSYFLVADTLTPPC